MFAKRISVLSPQMRSYSSSSKLNAKVKIFGFSSSQPTRSVLFLCKEAKIDYEMTSINAMKMEHVKNAEFMKLNPAGQLPCIVDNGFVLAESGAILQYLAEANGLTDWFPTDVKERAKINFWMHWHHTHTRHGTMQLLLYAYILPKKTDEIRDAGIKKGVKLMTKAVSFINDQLAANNTKYLVGNHKPSIADLLLLPELDQLTKPAYDLFDFTPYPHVQRYMETMSKELKSYNENFGNVVEMAASRKALY